MRFFHTKSQWPIFGVFVLLAATLSLSQALATEKLVDKTLYANSPKKEGVYRWSEGSIVSIDGKNHLMMVVTALGFGGHDDTPGDILRADSLDGGRTWTPMDQLTVFQKNLGKANVMSPSLLRLDNGDLLCFFMLKNRALVDCGTWVRRSADNGKTWSEPKRLPYDGYGGLSSDRALQTSTGRIIVPSWVSHDSLNSTHVYCFYSDDLGKSWKRTAYLAMPKGSSGRKTNPAAEEPMVVELEDGRLMMFIRNYLKSIYASYSDDNGTTWSKPKSSGIPAPGAMPTVRRMPDGNLLLIYNYGPWEKIDGPWPRNQLASLVSTDNGKSWSSLQVLDGAPDFPGKITMANVTFVDQNTVITYSKSQTRKNAYAWQLQVIPTAWFYEGDRSVTFGEPYLPTLEAKLTKETPKPAPRVVGKNHQLFLDDSLIENLDQVERIVNQPNKYHENPVLTYDRPWEGNCVITWGSVLYDAKEKQFKVWYEVYKKFPPKGEDSTLICYATSRDGIHWEKPNLGLFQFRGSMENNIVFGGNVDSPVVMANPRPTPEAKYLLFWHNWHDRTVDKNAPDYKKPGIRSATSPDGIHWTRVPGIRVESGDRFAAGYDSLREKFYIVTRTPKSNTRTAALWESEDGVKFNVAKEILLADQSDPPETQIYGLIPFHYEGLHIGFLEPFYIPLRKLDTQLVYSRDGVDWRRACDRQTFLPWGPPGSWDQAWVTPSHNGPIRVGDKLYIFYQGRSTLHWAEKPFGHIGSVGLAFLRPDGFVSIETQWNEGSVTTVPVKLEGKTLHVNAMARPGTVRAEVLDQQGKVIDGFSKDDCQAMRMTDSLDQILTWKNHKTLDTLAGKTVRLKFYVQGAKLYSFWSE